MDAMFAGEREPFAEQFNYDELSSSLIALTTTMFIYFFFQHFGFQVSGAKAENFWLSRPLPDDKHA